ncbi:MAG: hypothetical protein IKH33_07795 [Bacteroidales bacterium]|nr:hypothetical protein [Bacteroidales bacterium]
MSEKQNIWKVVQYVSVVCVMVATALCWWEEFLFVVLMVLAGWLLLPMVVVVVVSWIMNLKVRKALFVLDSVALVFLIAYFTIGNAQQRCDADIMERHLAKKQDAMLAAINYTHQALAKDSKVTIEFRHGRVETFYINNGTYSAIDEADLQQKMRFVGLTKEEMRNIRRMLRQAGCIGITTHADYTELWYRRVGFGLYLYRFYNRPIPADEWDKMDCSLIPYNDTVVFEYAGGAIGGICFPGREEYLEVRRKN